MQWERERQRLGQESERRGPGVVANDAPGHDTNHACGVPIAVEPENGDEKAGVLQQAVCGTGAGCAGQ